jgi:hypothetical protein
LEAIARASCADLRRGLFVSSGELPLLADSQSVSQGGRHIELFNRLLNSVFFIGSLNRAEMFGAAADDIDTPVSHSHINAHKKRAIVTIIVAKTIAKIASKRMARLIAIPCRLGSAASAVLSS